MRSSLTVMIASLRGPLLPEVPITFPKATQTASTRTKMTWKMVQPNYSIYLGMSGNQTGVEVSLTPLAWSDRKVRSRHNAVILVFIATTSRVCIDP